MGEALKCIFISPFALQRLFPPQLQFERHGPGGNLGSVCAVSGRITGYLFFFFFFRRAAKASASKAEWALGRFGSPRGVKSVPQIAARPGAEILAPRFRSTSLS